MPGIALSLFKMRPGMPAGRGLVPAASRNMLPQSATTSASAGAINSVARRVNASGADLTGIVIQVFNAYYDTSMTLVMGGSDITWSASIEYPVGGPRWQAKKNGAASFILTAADSFGRFDPIPGLTIPTGAAYLVRLYQTIPAGGRYVSFAGSLLAALGEASVFGAVGTNPDRTLTGSPAAANGAGGIQCWVLGSAPAGTPSAVIIGDSIDAGLSENSAFTGDANGNIGAADRYLAGIKGYNTLNLGRASSQAAHWQAKDLSVLLTWLSGIRFTAKWCGLGRNDLASSASPATLKASVEATLAKFPATSRVFVRDISPATNSTDGWATVNNQSRTGGAIGQESNRVSYNAIVAANGIAGQTDYFTFAASCQATTSGGVVVWAAPGGTTDGLHPTGAVNAAAVAAN